jgi:hypothetical protein
MYGHCDGPPRGCAFVRSATLHAYPAAGKNPQAVARVRASAPPTRPHLRSASALSWSATGQHDRFSKVASSALGG